MRLSNRIALTLCACVFLLWIGGPESTHAEDAKPQHLRHRIAVTLDPLTHRLEVSDQVEHVPVHEGKIRFRANASLKVTCLDEATVLSQVPVDRDAGRVARHINEYLLAPAPGEPAWSKPRTVALRLVGAIKSPLRRRGDSLGGVVATTGVVSKEGVFLSGASGWLPKFDAGLMTFELVVDTPKGWRALSQGASSSENSEGDRWSVTWTCNQPMDEVYLIANRFQVYTDETGPIRSLAYLLRPDEKLANTYLQATKQYIAMYAEMIGPYPYTKFALVENFWESGFGMPSFTLLGSRVIRFPFILTTSYPHEILHNWWGNSVYVDWSRGNWCEGLTAYLADHLMKEVDGKGAEHRFGVLKKYRNYVRAGSDFPLSKFRSRHSAATQAVGYGKALMVFHMLRRRLGEPAFKRALRTFYKDFRFKKASWTDIESVFSRAAGEPLKDFFAQWVTRTGAPRLAIEVRAGAQGTVLVVRQEQEGPPYKLQVPVAITVEGQSDAQMLTLSLSKRSQEFPLSASGSIVRVDVDPRFDVFRVLDRREIPPSLGELFGAQRVLFVVPSGAESTLDAATWARFPAGWKRAGVQVEVVASDQLESLPKDTSVWVLGAGNRWRDALKEDLVRRAGTNPGADLKPADSFVCATRHPSDPGQAIGWIATEHAAAIPGLLRKLPHYSSFSYVSFTGDAPTATDKGKWTPGASLLTWRLSKPGARRASLPPEVLLARPQKAAK